MITPALSLLGLSEGVSFALVFVAGVLVLPVLFLLTEQIDRRARRRSW
jgi:hypothetical protein